MKSIMNRTTVITGAKTAILGMALIGLASCSSGESTTSQPTSGGSAALQSPLVFVNNTGDRTLSSIALRGDSGNSELGRLGPGVFGGLALADMQFSLGEWIFVNVSGLRTAATMAEVGTQVATIDPFTRAIPVHEVNLTTGTRPVHIYRDPTDREVMWSMNDGLPTTAMPGAPSLATPGDDLINCNNPARDGGAIEGGVSHDSPQLASWSWRDATDCRTNRLCARRWT